MDIIVVTLVKGLCFRFQHRRGNRMHHVSKPVPGADLSKHIEPRAVEGTTEHFVASLEAMKHHSKQQKKGQDARQENEKKVVPLPVPQTPADINAPPREYTQGDDNQATPMEEGEVHEAKPPQPKIMHTEPSEDKLESSSDDESDSSNSEEATSKFSFRPGFFTKKDKKEKKDHHKKSSAPKKMPPRTPSSKVISFYYLM